MAEIAAATVIQTCWRRGFLVVESASTGIQRFRAYQDRASVGKSSLAGWASCHAVLPNSPYHQRPKKRRPSPPRGDLHSALLAFLHLVSGPGQRKRAEDPARMEPAQEALGIAYRLRAPEAPGHGFCAMSLSCGGALALFRSAEASAWRGFRWLVALTETEKPRLRPMC